ncbi:acyl-CoA dehydrogenase family protein [Conexibacter sp. CPCC 206217]|uniref:acyl-CoA dehydrogenase family protein n=1 Tax=Conexibacter sp. CPCC 206217 TaxID=3064574 RepID=UPI002720C4BE|nr:acyl-CoA dehydrogenase family protein [Conexibacter sp. CPCC 206217]MDO8212590.1 acyl-CoA dehydrogenase family protein [Conexibacter sp. CPCC 206217]
MSLSSEPAAEGGAQLDDAQKQAIVDAVGEFARREIAPRVAEYDLAETLPLDLLQRMSELQFFGGVVPVSEGGLGLDFVTYARLIEELSKTCHIMGTLASLPSGLVGASLLRYGTPEQRERWLRPLAQGRIFGAAGVTEPQSGSDVASMRTTYRRDGSDFVINGAKAWISGLNVASFVLTFATRDRDLRHGGVSAFVIPRDTPGMSLHPYKNKLGFRPLSTGEVVLDEVRVPADALLGEEGSGFDVAMTAVERGRLGVAARGVGVTAACLEDTIAYANEREAFSHPISEFQIVQSKITDMEVGATTSRLLVEHCARALQAGQRARKLTSMAKMHATDVAMRSATDALQVHGAAGVSPDHRVGRLFRDAKVLQIVEGSNDLHRALIGEIAVGLRRDKAAPAVR